MISKDKVLHIIKSPKPSYIEEMQAEHKKLVMHVHGVGVSDYLAKIEGLESEIKKNLRKRFARSNKDLFADILRPTDKIFNSQGGSKSYQFKNIQSKENFTKSLSDIVDGYSIAQWLQMFFVDKIVIDPNGLYLIEHKDNKPYPTYKSILSIRDYEVSGRGVNWIVFEPVKIDHTKSLVRVYDEQFDYAYILENEQLRLDDGNTFKNPWGYVPAVTCSDRVNPLSGRKQSYVYEQVELADEYLRENSIKTLFKYHHGFPLFWQYMAACPVCKGQGFLDGKVCPSCNGTKYAQKKDISDVTYLKQPENSETPTIAPDIAGYVVPPIETWQQMTEELKMMRDMIYFSHWGTVINREDTDKTAFEVALNTQPMQDRLNHYTNSLESTEKYIVDMLAEYQFKGDYEGCSINYGRNYIIKSPNQYLTEYLEEKGKKASASVLNGKLEMYYNALYANDDYNRVVSLKLMYVEPFVHNDISEVVGWNVDGELIAKKIYYNDWVSQLDKDSVLTKTIPELQAELTAFVSGKYKPNNKQDEA